jgi:hypothetical protein
MLSIEKDYIALVTDEEWEVEMKEAKSILYQTCNFWYSPIVQIPVVYQIKFSGQEKKAS